jgi:hypothetical protein
MLKPEFEKILRADLADNHIAAVLFAEIDRLRKWGSHSHVTDLEREVEHLKNRIEFLEAQLGNKNHENG